ncbi:putative U3 small nucleolar RNA-associated protein 7 [Fulvia fulva]|uniref:U three protein 7 n=1 Tax=Passalora fulva TaxID=5499 RepID=A0A9Q8P3L5_PASFU|nr:putative U3 small nucleolar RNA-associated protein 7 [Fulvia fulva]KAK4634842.1 putative U3 small nucleolar RNA-associated protein 7 [Fulvia fulva]KAK4636873.1 putative U3 small nucleolar RNA-associated protein 7 [Fulvia fulva]UJO11881.1 putative U3 small nucleolar RNA-associated protein 7 [Fulvia fulva]WPV08871.1 putative U3 small nucleolar RNA-associated protein 7 [Fulvia fulva]WPV24134.1 putative U3 small nucleolar RNA-associated protein 7 [Fulvia fulva]
MAEVETTDLVGANGKVKVQRQQKRAGPTARLSAEHAALKKRQQEANARYGRGKAVQTKGIKDKKLRETLKKLEGQYKDAALKAKDAEILLEHQSGFLEPEGELERTYKVRQDEIRSSVAVETAKQNFELKDLGLGPYTHDYTRNGRDLLLAGRKGHVATFDWRSGKLGCELQLGETVRDAKWLHNNQYFAVAQKKNVYIYDHHGVEIHKLDQHVEVTHMEFLPYHFLLATIGNAGWLKWQDTSTGKLVMQMGTKQGTPTAFGQNPYNAILHVGHQNGTVSLWSPNVTTPLVKMLCHRGPVRSLAVDREGRYMVSTGQDMKMAVWDVRNFKPVHEYFLRQPGSSLAISDTNLTAVGWGTQTSIWKDLFSKHRSDIEQVKVQSPYMSWGAQGETVERVRWCPYTDTLGIGHNKGFSSIIVPGAGEANYDAMEQNPYENSKQRQEAEVKSLLNKLQPETISLDPNFVGNLDTASHEQRKLEKDLDRKTGAEAEKERIEDLKNRGRGKNSSLRKYLRKKGNKNVIDEHKMRVMEMREKQRQRVKEIKEGRQAEELGPALSRFARKGG